MFELIVLCLVVALSTGNADSIRTYNYESVEYFGGLDPSEVRDLKELAAPHAQAISEYLSERLELESGVSKGYDPLRVLQLIREQWNYGNFERSNLPKQSMKKPLELLVSLEKTVGRCDAASYEILAKNFIMIEALEDKLKAHAVVDVFRYFGSKHRESCRSVLKRRYSKKLSKISAKDQGKLEKVFLIINMFSYYKYQPLFDPIAMSRPVLAKSAAALESLVRALKTPEDRRTFDSDSIRPLLDDNIFKPCQNYRHHLASVLDEACIDALVGYHSGEARIQSAYLRESEQFYRALITNRMCQSLLIEQNELYEPMAALWNQTHE